MNNWDENTIVENLSLKIEEHKIEVEAVLKEQEAARIKQFNESEQFIIFGRSRPETMIPEVLQALAWHERELVELRLGR